MLKVNGRRQNGYLEDDNTIVTWCVGHLVALSYPEKYDMKYKRWAMDSLPFLPDRFLYEVIGNVKTQFEIVSGLLNRDDVDTIYICTDSGREGEYIYRLVDQMAGVDGKTRKRVWIDSQTEEEILRGIREAKDWSAYDGLGAAAYLRAQEDYLMGINFSRALTLRYGQTISAFLKQDRTVLSVGRVMTCVLGMVVRREREIRSFVKTPFYRVVGSFSKDGVSFEAEWKAVEGSDYLGSPKLYKENGFKKREDAEELIRALNGIRSGGAKVLKSEKKKEVRNAPLLYNLAEIQNDCSKRFRINPDETLKIIQELYEKKLVTYPRTDARVISSAVAKEIDRNIGGLTRLLGDGPRPGNDRPGAGGSAETARQPGTGGLTEVGALASEVLAGDAWRKIGKSRYTNDSQITDHYAIIPTGQGLGALRSLKGLQRQVYEMICRRFLSIFYPPAVFEKRSVELQLGKEHFFANFRFCVEEGWMKAAGMKPGARKGSAADAGEGGTVTGAADAGGTGNPDGGAAEDNAEGGTGEDPNKTDDASLMALAAGLRKGSTVQADGFTVKEGETSPPKRYTSGSMILAMENAGQLIEDEELRSQIKGSGIGTSATRAEILKKLVNIRYLALNAKTQVITPTLLGEMCFEAVELSMKQLLNPELTASWEKGLTYVAEGTITPDEYMQKLRTFITRRTDQVKTGGGNYQLREAYDRMRGFYREPASAAGRSRRKRVPTGKAKG